jgi:mannosyltransferase OCH1-like enzyme
MGAAPRHPFLLYVIERLQAYDRDWKLGYITVMYTTGPLFLSVLWKEWMKGGRNVGDGPGGGRVRVMQQNHYQRVAESFFLEFLGSSWHGDDARFIFWMGDNWLLLTLAGLAAAAAVAVLLWWLYQRALALAQSRDWAKRGWRAALGRVGRKEYELVDRRVD